MYGVKLAEKLNSAGVEVVVSYPSRQDTKYGSIEKFLIATGELPADVRAVAIEVQASFIWQTASGTTVGLAFDLGTIVEQVG